jgi:hypothetical protein
MRAVHLTTLLSEDNLTGLIMQGAGHRPCFSLCPAMAVCIYSVCTAILSNSILKPNAILKEKLNNVVSWTQRHAACKHLFG